MADSDAPSSSSKPAAVEPPKPVHIGGESFVDRVLPHIKKILFACVALAAVAGVIFGIRAWKQRGQRSQTTALAAVIDVASRELRGSGAVDPKKPSFVDTKERAATVLDTLTKQETELAGPGFKAGFLLDTKKFDEAITEYEKCTTGETIENVLCREGKALALEAKAAAATDASAKQAGFEAALAAFKEMQPDDEGLRAAYAHWHQGRILHQMQKLTEAKAELEKAKELGKDTADLPDLVEKRLAELGA